MKGITRYSKDIPGSSGNYQWPVRFDKTDSFLGIGQSHGEMSGAPDRVLLDGNQVKALLRFLRNARKAKTPRPKKRAKR